MARAFMPMTRLSPRATTPRTIGRRSQRRVPAHGVIGWSVTATSPSGVRTATDQWPTLRIITPSMTA